MILNRQNRRWYDYDPTVSMSISLLRNASLENQIAISRYISEKGRHLGIEVKESIFAKFGIFQKRWYDTDENIYKAMEVLKLCPEDIQKSIALEIINQLYNLDIEKDSK